MPVCIEDFECEYDGETVVLRAGLDFVADGHEIARRYPRKFGASCRAPARVRPRAARRSSAWPKADWPPPPAAIEPARTRALPKLRTGEPRLNVRIYQSARDTIRDEFLAVTIDAGCESGGWLYAEPARSWHGQIDVSIARRPGRGAKHGPYRYMPSGDYIDAEEGFARNGAGHFARVGDWHSHTGGDAEPSDADLHAWQGSFLVADEKRHIVRYVGLVVARDNPHNYKLRLNPFVLSFDHLGRIVCESVGLA